MSHKQKGKKSLPENFANTIMELEMDIESGKITSESVNRLTALYMEAVEFYESTESAKYGFFQDKLTKLLTNNKIYEQMEEESKNNKKSDQKSEETRQASDHSKFNSKKQMELDIMMGEKKNKDMTNELLRVYGTSHVTLDKIVKNNLLSQEKSINQRLEQRKLNKSSSQSQRSLSQRSIEVSIKKEDSSVTGKLIASSPRGDSTEDPYGFGKIVSPEAKSLRDLNDSPEQAKTEEKKAGGKMNFLNRLKKTASPTIRETNEISGENKNAIEEVNKGEEKETKATKHPFKLVVTGVKSQNVGKDKILKNISMTKEELEGMQAQFEIEEDEDAKVEWGREVDSLLEKLRKLERELQDLDESEITQQNEEKEPEKVPKEEEISHFEATEGLKAEEKDSETQPVAQIKKKDPLAMMMSKLKNKSKN